MEFQINQYISCLLSQIVLWLFTCCRGAVPPGARFDPFGPPGVHRGEYVSLETYVDLFLCKQNRTTFT